MESNWPEAWPNVVESVDEVYTFDPNGDILLQLQKTIPVKAGETIPVCDESQSQEATDKESVTLEETSPLEPLLGEESLEFQPSTSTKEDGLWDWRAPQPGQGEKPALDSTLTVYLRVSSRHLILASAVFNSMLSSDTFSEGRTLLSEGNLVVKLSDDPEALIVLMYIVHGMTRKVPRNIPLYTLADLANLVNYYKLHEAVELFSDTWVTWSRQELPLESYDPEVVLRWLFISWVFQKGDDFEKMTRILICESDDRLEDNVDDERIPIPASIIQRIQECRVEAIARTITVIHDYITTYLTPDILCSNNKQFSCDAIVLGSLLKGSAAIGIWPRPEVPYHGITFKSLASQVREMQVLDNCNQRDRYYSSGNGHGVKDAIEASIRSLEDQFCGLKLGSFLPEAQNRKKSKADKKKWKKKVDKN